MPAIGRGSWASNGSLMNLKMMYRKIAIATRTKIAEAAKCRPGPVVQLVRSAAGRILTAKIDTATMSTRRSRPPAAWMAAPVRKSRVNDRIIGVLAIALGLTTFTYGAVMPHAHATSHRMARRSAPPTTERSHGTAR